MDIIGASHFLEVNINTTPSMACHMVHKIKLPSEALHNELKIYFGSRSLPEFL
jgi:hypothetical protein